ncbi:MAG TPA: peptidylprolyl isomerase [Burkholderiaceae bacterium]
MNPLPLDDTTAIARVNGVPLHAPDERLDDDALRQRACTELLRQEARARGLERDSDAAAIEALLEQALQVPEPGEDDCRRSFDAHPARFAQGERLALRHVLFAVTPGVDVNALRRRAEALLLDLRCADPATDAFADAARQWSNCPTGATGGDLGWVTRQDCADEFARQVFGQQTVGILQRLVHSRFGFHVVEVRERDPGVQPAFEDVAQAVALRLRQRSWSNALRQYLQVLAGRARVEGVELEGAATPLVR